VYYFLEDRLLKRAQMGRKLFSFKYLAALLLTVAVLILGGMNAQQKRRYVPPDDGVSWIQGPAGIEARVVVSGGPADKLVCHFVEADRMTVDSNSIYGRVAESCFEIPELPIDVYPDTLRRKVARVQNQYSVTSVRRTNEQGLGIGSIAKHRRSHFQAVGKNVCHAGFTV